MEQHLDYENIQYNDHRLPIAYDCRRSLGPENRDSLRRPRWHEQMECKLILSGKAEISCGSNVFLAEEGDVVIINACELHSIVPVGETEVCYHVVMLSPLPLYGEMPGQLLAPYLDGALRFQNHVRGDSRCQSLFLSLMEEMEGQAAGYSLAAVGYFSLLFTELIRRYTEPGSRSSSPDTLSRYAEKLEPAFVCISGRYREELTLQQLADICGISLYHFSRIFKQVTGQSVIAYLNDYRMSKAEMLIRSTAITISEISAAVGYTDNSYFTRAFRKRYGLAPSEYRRHIINQEEISQSDLTNDL